MHMGLWLGLTHARQAEDDDGGETPANALQLNDETLQLNDEDLTLGE